MNRLKAKIPQKDEEKESTFHIPETSEGRGKIAPPKKEKPKMENLHVRIPSDIKENLKIASVRHKKEMGEIVAEWVKLWISQLTEE